MKMNSSEISRNETNSENEMTIVKNSKRLTILITLFAFLLPDYIVFARHYCFDRYALWYFRTEPDIFGMLIGFTFSEPVNNSIFWLPEVYIAFEVYRVGKNRFQTRRRFLTKVILATIIQFISYTLVVIYTFPYDGTYLVPLPYATVIALIFGLKMFPAPMKEPWIGE